MNIKSRNLRITEFFDLV